MWVKLCVRVNSDCAIEELCKQKLQDWIRILVLFVQCNVVELFERWPNRCMKKH